jgi:ABC-type lipoprotein release transport system permease subunit
MADLLMNRHTRSGPAIRFRVRADLRGRRLPAASVVLVVTLATLLIGLALAVFGSIQVPFDRLFTQLNGAHLWVYYLSSPTQGQLDAVAHAPNVAATTGLEEATGNAAVLLASQKFGAYLQSFPTQQPAIGQLLITQGNELASDDPDGVIINQPFADAQHLQVGDPLALVTPQGLTQVHVRGLSIDVNHVSQSEASQPRIYLSRATFARLYPQPDRWVVGLRLVDPYAIGPTTDIMLQRLQAQGYRERFLAYDDWLSYRKDFGADSRLTATLLLAFGIVSLLAAGVIVANLVIAVCAALPAWRAGRTRVVDAIRPGGVAPRGGRARLAGLMFATGLPVVVALGVRGVTARPLRTLLVLLTLLLGVMTAVFDLGQGRQVAITYTVVGSLYATQKLDEAYAPLNSLATHTTIPFNELLANTEYEVTLRPGISPQAFAQRMQTLTTDRIGVKVYDLTPQGGVTQGPLIMLFLSIALMIVAGVGMLNAMVLSTRERYRELASLKAIGSTPRQVLGSVINGAVVLGILAVIIGIPLGLRLNTVIAQALSNSIGGPPNIQISINWLGLALLVPATLLVAVLGAYVPARWAARVPAAEVLRYE